MKRNSAKSSRREIFAAIKERLSIGDVISPHTEINRRGFALCPLHGDKTPSLKVDASKGLWHCFGCGEGGDIFHFIEKIHNCDRAGSLKILADMAGIDISAPVTLEISKEIRERKEARRRRELFEAWVDRTYNALADEYRELWRATYVREVKNRDRCLDLLAPLYHRMSLLENYLDVLDGEDVNLKLELLQHIEGRS